MIILTKKKQVEILAKLIVIQRAICDSYLSGLDTKEQRKLLSCYQKIADIGSVVTGDNIEMFAQWIRSMENDYKKTN